MATEHNHTLKKNKIYLFIPKNNKDLEINELKDSDVRLITDVFYDGRDANNIEKYNSISLTTNINHRNSSIKDDIEQFTFEEIMSNEYLPQSNSASYGEGGGRKKQRKSRKTNRKKLRKTSRKK